ncbi:MAG TPA: PucR family transcriptional regulator ligand-binding domain-containing protein, partial [Dermatophilaceae bacterium]
MVNVAKNPASSRHVLPDTARSRASDVVVSMLGLSLRAVLEMECLGGARILAGHAGLDRVVSRLNVMEVPDILPWVRPNQLLLTTGYP